MDPGGPKWQKSIFFVATTTEPAQRSRKFKAPPEVIRKDHH
jgi:hypothetical protein